MSVYHGGEKIREEDMKDFYEQIDKWIEEGNQGELEKISMCLDMFEEEEDNSSNHEMRL
jgi:hypothetical protein